MRLGLCALLFVASCGEPEACSAIGSSTFGGGAIAGGGVFGRTNTSVTTLLDFFPAAMTLSSPTIEACTTANNCVLDCTATSVGGPWLCVDGSGNAVPVTQGTGADTVTTPWGTALKRITDAKAPRLTTPAAFESFWTQPHTVIFVGYATTLTSSIPFELAQTVAGKGHEMRFNDNGCSWYNSGAAPTSVTTGLPSAGASSVVNGFSVYSCRKTGTGAGSSYTARVNGAEAAASWAADPAAPTGGNLVFGRNTGAGEPTDGPSPRVRFYSADIGAARLSAIEAAYQGANLLAADGTTLIDHLSAAGPIFYVDPNTGFAWPYGNNSAEVESSGIPIEERNSSEVGGAGCNFASDCLDASSYAKLNAGGGHATHPTVTTNVASGPFATWKNTAEADEVVDDDATTFECVCANNSADNAVDHDTCSAYLGLGTSGTTLNKAQFQWQVTGGGTATPSSCNATITGTGPLGYDLYQCPTVTSGTVTTLKCCICEGNAASDTGSFRTSQVQVDRQPRAQAGRLVTNTAQGRDLYHVPAASTAAWKAAGLRDNGTMSAIFTLNHDVPGDEIDDPHDAWFVEDMSVSGDTDHRITMFYEVSGSYNHNFCVRLEDGTGTNVDICSPNNITFARNTQYIATMKWGSCDATHTNRWLWVDTCANAATCAASTLIASSTNCTLKKPASDTWGRLLFGNRYSNSFGLNGRLARFKVTTP